MLADGKHPGKNNGLGNFAQPTVGSSLKELGLQERRAEIAAVEARLAAEDRAAAVKALPEAELPHHDGHRRPAVDAHAAEVSMSDTMRTKQAAVLQKAVDTAGGSPDGGATEGGGGGSGSKSRTKLRAKLEGFRRQEEQKRRQVGHT
jgi:hypothetical protein